MDISFCLITSTDNKYMNFKTLKQQILWPMVVYTWLYPLGMEKDINLSILEENLHSHVGDLVIKRRLS